MRTWWFERKCKRLGRGTCGALKRVGVRLCYKFSRDLELFIPESDYLVELHCMSNVKTFIHPSLMTLKMFVLCRGFSVKHTTFELNLGLHLGIFNLLRSFMKDTGAFQYAGSLLKCSPWAWHYCAFLNWSSNSVVCVCWRSSCCKVCGVLGICSKLCVV